MRLERLSPSQLTLYRANPCLWLGKYRFGWREDFGPAASRGNAIEAGLNHALSDSVRLVDRSLPYAMERFELDAQGVADDDVQKQRELIEPMLAQAIMACGGWPSGPMYQVRVEHHIEGVSVPILGYLDFEWADRIVDLKTTERIPSEPRADHILQCAIYSDARKKPASLLYVSGKKFQWYELTPEQIAEGLADARRAAQAIESLCIVFDTPQKAARVMTPNFDDFRWSDTTREAAKAVWS